MERAAIEFEKTNPDTAWDDLSVETQATLINISHQETRQARDIALGLLATLHGYQGVKKVKKVFADAIKKCEELFDD